LACATCYEGDEWNCPLCGTQPEWRDGLICFLEEDAGEDSGFKANFFPELAVLEGRNFWFPARNKLIRWALKKYFPRNSSFLEIGCGTGFVLAGIRQYQPAIRLAGSEM